MRLTGEINLMNRHIIAAAAFGMGLALAHLALAQSFAGGVVTAYDTAKTGLPCSIFTLNGPLFTPNQTFALFPPGDPGTEDLRGAVLASISAMVPLTIEFGAKLPQCQNWPRALVGNISRINN
jgi:hypothetical protein